MTRYFEAAAAGDAFESQGTECTTREAILHFASSAPAGVADPRWMKPRATRCPGDSRDPPTRCSCGRQVGPASAGAAFDVVLRHRRLVSCSS